MAAQKDTLLRRGELERLSALETLKGLSDPGDVKLAELIGFLESRELWEQFSKITLGDLRDAFTPGADEPAEPDPDEADTPKARKRRIMKEVLMSPAELDGEGGEEPPGKVEKKAPADGGLSTEDVARTILPFVEGNGDVTLEDIAEYSRLERTVLRHHLGALCKDGRLERIGVGRNAVYSTVA